MYNREKINELIKFILENKLKSKPELIKEVVSKFSLTKDRSVFYNKYYAIRFSEAKSLVNKIKKYISKKDKEVQYAKLCKSY